MPFYEYECQKCTYRFEKIQSIKDDSLKECEQCHGELKRILFPPNVIYHGNGFYATDYRKEDNHKENKKDSCLKESGLEKKVNTGEKEDKKETKDVKV